MSGCPTTRWCRVTYLILKHALPARRDSAGVSVAPLASVLAAALESTLSDRYLHDHGVGWGCRLLDQATVPCPYDIV